MTPAQAASAAYARAARPVRSARGIEYDVVSRISHRLRVAAAERGNAFPAYAAALSDNRRLWSVLAADVAQPGNGLPDDLRGRLFWLAEFVDAETRRLLRGVGDPGVLIEINAAVMQGLRETEPAS